jgi:hypothetical protein
MFKVIRISILLFLLVFISWSAYRTKMQSVEWKYTLPVNIYPINGDGSAVTERYIRGLNVDEFEPIEKFMRDAADHYGNAAKASIEVRLQQSINLLPPAPPEERSGLNVMWWSLKFRWWAYRHAKVIGPGPQVRLFVLYFDPEKNQVQHSTALQEGLIGRVNVFASTEMRQKNNVVIAHEFLHTLGATDKYDLNTDLPTFPDGYGEPELKPILPQRFAEIMGGRIVLNAREAVMPHNFSEVVIGSKTAKEINFMKKTD